MARASVAAAVRLPTPRFSYTCSRCFFTVLGATQSCAAICAFVLPSATRDPRLGGAAEPRLHGQQPRRRGQSLSARGRALLLEYPRRRLCRRGAWRRGGRERHLPEHVRRRLLRRAGPRAGLNTASNDFRPNLRRDGLEVFFDSNRSGGIGGLDLWMSTRASTSDPWSSPTNLGANVNSVANDLRASLSWDGTTLYFGSTRAGGEGSQDVYVTERAN